ncbi:hypothetical protein HUK80_17705 [Flavobacterium sp. MAH-1]|uniref:Competence protein J (ComJ) n=1 Tax=Flavobacterium agri TaxID=2743471 RepID=A0A7Y9C6X5_9FLAO|nr:hypothetical protein [Flavobacterium agri]NUY82743.1 hypothetical protein [Flavobacterium agri]NYA72766.1 hypothetical protein [Flavobacterium agri]
MKYKLNFFTQYHQFYLLDKDARQTNEALGNFWTDQAFADKLAVENGFLGIGVENDEGIVNCEISILDSRNLNLNFEQFDHVVEASIKIKSGIAQIQDCPNSSIELEFQLEPNDYRVRVYSINLKTAYDENPRDFYQIEIWKEKFSERNVLKRFLG